jgi:hypothetical protein
MAEEISGTCRMQSGNEKNYKKFVGKCKKGNFGDVELCVEGRVILKWS